MLDITSTVIEYLTPEKNDKISRVAFTIHLPSLNPAKQNTPFSMI